jgi:hypothetical protein
MKIVGVISDQSYLHYRLNRFIKLRSMQATKRVGVLFIK